MKRHTRYKRIHRDDHMHVYVFEVMPPGPQIMPVAIAIRVPEGFPGYIPHSWHIKSMRQRFKGYENQGIAE